MNTSMLRFLKLSLNGSSCYPAAGKCQKLWSSNSASSGHHSTEGNPEIGGKSHTRRKTGRGMKAWQIHSYGGLEDLQLTDSSRMPVIKLPSDVLIKVNAASVNPIDLAMAKGYGSNIINILRTTTCGFGGLPNLPSPTSSNVIEFPLILGRDFSGVVEAIGHGVTSLSVGDKVYGVIGVQRSGSHAEYTVASEDTVKRMPRNISFVEAASIPYVGLTSWAAIKITGSFINLNSKKFLVLGGSGGVGTLAIQYLKSQGSHIVSTCSQDSISLLEKLGTDFVVDYKQTDYLSHVKNFAPYDCILDLSGPTNASKASSLTKYLKAVTGQYITLSPPLLSNFDKYGLFGGTLKNLNDITYGNWKSLSTDRVPTKWAFFIPNGSALEGFTDLIEMGKIKPVIHETYRFEDLPTAYQRMEEGHLRGKIVIDMQ